MPTTKLNLPLIDGTNTADVVRDMNALANAVDNKAGAPDGLATLDATGKVPASQLNVSAPPDASTTVKGVVQLSNSTTSTSEVLAATPKAVKDVKDELDIHEANTSNPHGVTKAQVGLGSVENYAVATQAEAQAGAVTNKYMTPQRTKQAIDSQTGDRSTLNTSIKTTLVAAINELFTSVSNGKTQIATAITDKGVAASGGDTFPTLATKIGQISSEVTGETVRTLTAGVTLTKGERVEYGRNEKLANPSQLPTSTVSDVVFDSSNTYLAVAQSSSSPPIHIYKRSGDTFTKLANPSVLPEVGAQSCSFAQNGGYLAVSGINSPYLSIYKRSGDTFTKLANPSTLPPDYSYVCAFSPDDVHLVIGHQTSPFLTIYKRSGDTFTKLANPSTLPPNAVTSVTFSQDGVFMAVRTLGFNGSDMYIRVYKRSADTFTHIWGTSITTANEAFSRQIDFSENADYLAVPGTESPFVHIYKRSGDTFTKLADPSVLPTSLALSASFTPDGNHLYVSSQNNPRITIYKRSGDTFTAQSAPTVLPSNSGFGLNFSPNGLYWAVSHGTTSPYFFLYKTIGNVSKNTGVVTAGKSLGYAKTSASSGQNVDVAVLFE